MNTVIEMKNITKKYQKNTVIDKVSFAVKEGSIVGLVGPNGAGKTTVMKMLGGLVLPNDGEMTIFGEKTEKQLTTARSRMSFIIEAPYIKANLSGRDNLEIQRIQKGIPDQNRVKEVMEMVGLSYEDKKAAGKYSLGMKQRLGIANALMIKPEIMVLDEPINGLDPEGIIEIRELLRKLSKEEHITILISSHILSELSLLCTDYLFIHHGKLIKDISAEELAGECRQYYEIQTANNSLALTALQEKLNIRQFDIGQDGALYIYQKLDDLEAISKCLYESGFIPTKLVMREANLEQYYMDMVKEKADV